MTTPAPDPFASALWAIHDAEKNAKRDRPHTAPAPSPGEASGDVVHISDPNAYALSALQRTHDELATAHEGGRNHALNAAAFTLGRLVGANLLTEQAVTDTLIAATQTNGLLAEDGRYACEATIRSGLTGGARDPLRWQLDTGHTAPPVAPFNPPASSVNLAPPPPEGLPPLPPADLHAYRVAGELATLRAREEARDQLSAERASRLFKPLLALTLRDYLAQPPQPEPFLVDKVLPLGGNATLTAQFKAGKTTLVNNLVRAVVDSEPFLDRFEVNPFPGRVVIFNYEVGGDQYREWLRDVRIHNVDAVSVVNLRGLRAPLTVPFVEDQVVDLLQRLECGLWIVDPFARAFVGSGEENDNAAVGVWTDTVDVIKQRAGVHTFVMPVHTGRGMEAGKERARGATRLDDWADVRWLLGLGDPEHEDGRPPSFFSASGRDVEVDEEQLTFDPTTRHLHLGGPSRAMQKRDRVESDILAYVTANPGCSKADVQRAVKGRAASVADKVNALAVAGHKLHDKNEHAGKGAASRLFIGARSFVPEST